MKEQTFILAVIILLVLALTSAISQSTAKFAWSNQRLNQIGLINVTQNGHTLTTIGSGFVFGTNNDVVTCKHVFDAALRSNIATLVYSSPGGYYILTPKLIFTNFDVAVFSTEPKITNADPFVLGSFAELRTNSTVLYAGYDSRRNSGVMSASWISSIGQEMINNTANPYVDFPGEVIPGYSGGPAFNSRGEIIGIICERIQIPNRHDISRVKSINVLSVLLPK